MKYMESSKSRWELYDRVLDGLVHTNCVVSYNLPNKGILVFVVVKPGRINSKNRLRIIGAYLISDSMVSLLDLGPEEIKELDISNSTRNVKQLMETNALINFLKEGV